MFSALPEGPRRDEVSLHSARRGCTEQCGAEESVVREFGNELLHATLGEVTRSLCVSEDRVVYRVVSITRGRPPFLVGRRGSRVAVQHVSPHPPSYGHQAAVRPLHREPSLRRSVRRPYWEFRPARRRAPHGLSRLCRASRLQFSVEVDIGESRGDQFTARRAEGPSRPTS